MRRDGGGHVHRAGYMCSFHGPVSLLLKAWQEQRTSFFFCARRKNQKQQISLSITKSETEAGEMRRERSLRLASGSSIFLWANESATVLCRSATLFCESTTVFLMNSKGCAFLF